MALPIKSSVDILQQVLADTVILSYKLRNYHWNIKGIQFNDIHTFLGEAYDALDSGVDSIAERIRALQATPISSLKGFLDKTSLTESEPLSDPFIFLRIALKDYEANISFITSNYMFCDKTTENYLQEIVFNLQKAAWKIRSMVE